MQLSEQDAANFVTLMAKFADVEDGRGVDWAKLLDRDWPSLSALLDRAQDFIRPIDRREFRQMIDQLWLGR